MIKKAMVVVMSLVLALMCLVGCGGGASALLPYSAEQLNMRYSLAKHAEVISSIGVALAMIRDVVERVIPNPTTEDIRQIKKEAKEMAIKNGAVPDTIEVQIEIDNQTKSSTLPPMHRKKSGVLAISFL